MVDAIVRAFGAGLMHGMCTLLVGVSINYCKGKYLQLSKKQVHDILAVIDKLSENGIV